jgi:hypothetical protein
MRETTYKRSEYLPYSKLELISDEEAINIMMLRCGARKNPIGFYKEALQQMGVKANFRSLLSKNLIKEHDKKSSIGYYGSWIEIGLRGKNLYNRVKGTFNYER